VYCAENLLFSEQAMVEIGYESLPEVTRNAVRDSLAFKHWRRHLVEKLFPVYIEYAIAEELGVGTKTVSNNATQFIDKRKRPQECLSEGRVRKEAERVRRVCVEECGEDNYQIARKNIKRRAPKSISGKFHTLSGNGLCL
jgi:hypothetical protein